MKIDSNIGQYTVLSNVIPFLSRYKSSAQFQSSNGSFNQRPYTLNAQKLSWRSSAPLETPIATTTAATPTIMGIKDRGGTGDCGGTTSIICNSTISKRMYKNQFMI